MFTSSEFRGPFIRVLAWNLAFAFASVVVTFALGLLLAVVFNDVPMKGRKIYRSLLIIPYALPGFMTALVWKGMLNQTFGINRWLGVDIPWLTTTAMAMLSLILVNLWLGYPYMFLVNTGALQSIPSELKEAALVDGANGWTAFRRITFPLLLVTVSPLLIASFAFNFNNFTLVWLLTNGNPRATDESAGTTDILLSWTYRFALDLSPQRQGLAAALSVHHLPARCRDDGVRVQVHEGLGGSEMSLTAATTGVYSLDAGARGARRAPGKRAAGAGSVRQAGATSSACSHCFSPSSRCGSWSLPPSRRARR